MLAVWSLAFGGIITTRPPVSPCVTITLARLLWDDAYTVFFIITSLFTTDETGASWSDLERHILYALFWEGQNWPYFFLARLPWQAYTGCHRYFFFFESNNIGLGRLYAHFFAHHHFYCECPFTHQSWHVLVWSATRQGQQFQWPRTCLCEIHWLQPRPDPDVFAALLRSRPGIVLYGGTLLIQLALEVTHWQQGRQRHSTRK